jgi:S-adenosylmethionine-diacylglycerol 3-amino-3-carboxypropyl transferase
VTSDAIGERADFSRIRYAQVWEDADVLLEGLAVRPGDRCLAIASAGDNALALLTARPAEVVALDLSGAQLACLALRVAAFRTLTHGELLELVGSSESTRRAALYARCRRALPPAGGGWGPPRPPPVAGGIGRAGKFERYFAWFRRVVLPLTQRRADVAALAAGGPPLGADEKTRRAWYDRHWDNVRWRLVFRVFTSRFVLGRLGRDPRFFDHVEGSVADRLLTRVRQAVTATDPAENAYLQWILTGQHRTALPLWLRPASFEPIREHLDRLTWRRTALEDVLDESAARSFDRFALSDVFEYVPPAHYERLLERIAEVGRPGARLAYWNLLAPRRRPERLAEKILALPELSRALHARDRAPFYGAFVVEEVRG